jgi:hypothetical protein
MSKEELKKQMAALMFAEIYRQRQESDAVTGAGSCDLEKVAAVALDVIEGLGWKLEAPERE